MTAREVRDLKDRLEQLEATVTEGRQWLDDTITDVRTLAAVLAQVVRSLPITNDDGMRPPAITVPPHTRDA